MKTLQMKQREKKNWLKKNSICDLWDNVKSSVLTCIYLELRGERNHDKKTISKTVAKYFLNILLQLLNLEIHKVHQSSNKKKENK